MPLQMVPVSEKSLTIELNCDYKFMRWSKTFPYADHLEHSYDYSAG